MCHRLSQALSNKQNSKYYGYHQGKDDEGLEFIRFFATPIDQLDDYYERLEMATALANGGVKHPTINAYYLQCATEQYDNLSQKKAKKESESQSAWCVARCPW